MTDELGFPVLAASALTQAIAFLYHRAEVVLDRRAARSRSSEAAPAEQWPAVVAGNPGRALDFDPDNVTMELADRLESLLDVLDVYTEHEQLIDNQDERLRRALGRLRAVLEEAYGRRITFVGEDRPASGMRIFNRAGDVHGVSRALKAGRVSILANIDVEHTAQIVRPGAEMTSVEIDDLL
ncbi:hypothetical protein F4556_006006 [Kitasatospora gansuensis]|uniref:Uncharacterized protein n=1 Tax=Kitasatospora gansuensis TaxID=258050 RepID=A0A7W7SJJ0_9ACTN|nr:hypothetical protein [Kitasatospora gansuensis]MBB4950471.1 hypothetical protein [Kitasatospora gansuensis]